MGPESTTLQEEGEADQRQLADFAPFHACSIGQKVHRRHLGPALDRLPVASPVHHSSALSPPLYSASAPDKHLI